MTSKFEKTATLLVLFTQTTRKTRNGGVLTRKHLFTKFVKMKEIIIFLPHYE